VYAGFLSHAYKEISRLLDYLEHSGQLENTMIVLVSDNGASGEGGPNGSVNKNKLFNGLPNKIEEALPFLDDLGSPRIGPTTTIRPAGRARSTLRSSCGSATPTGRAAPPIQ
jgi:arylsulfatase A-like enzyme